MSKNELFKVWLCFVSVLTLSLYSYAQDESLNYKSSQSFFGKTSLQTDFNMSGISFSEGQDESQLVGLLVSPEALVRLSEDFTVSGNLELFLASSRTQTRYLNPSFNILNLMELVAIYHPIDYFNLVGGAINQEKVLNNRMLVANRSFPGVMMTSKVGNKKISATGKIQYAIPTSTSLESNRTETEELPSI